MARCRATSATSAPRDHIHDPCWPEWRSGFLQYQSTWSAPSFPASLPSASCSHSVFLPQNSRRSKHTPHDAHHASVLILTHISPSKFPFASLSLEKSSFSLQGIVKWCCLHHILPHFPLINSSSFTQHLSCLSVLYQCYICYLSH